MSILETVRESIGLLRGLQIVLEHFLCCSESGNGREVTFSLGETPMDVVARATPTGEMPSLGPPDLQAE
jgi:hypothetical protein